MEAVSASSAGTHDQGDRLVVTRRGYGAKRITGKDVWGPPEDPDHAIRVLRRATELGDLYQLHAPDPDVPYEESIGALKEMQDEGKIRLIGVSNVDFDELDIARGIVDVVSVQNRYNLTDRSSEDVLERCEELGIAFIPWFPLATGDLAQGGGRRGAGRALTRVAARLDATPAQVALAWLLARSPVMLPTPGTASLTHLEENVAAGALELSEDDYTELEEAA
jgi:aryl-alcohol dehydrogenase-like predicted oxidoreductase